MPTRSLISLLALSACAWAAESIDPTWLRKNASEVTDVKGYKALFEHEKVLRSVIRYGEQSGPLDPVKLDDEEQIYVVLSGSATVLYQGARVPVRQGDFMYFAPGSLHGLEGAGFRIVLMGFRASLGEIPERLPLANLDEVKLQTVNPHPPSVRYQLMIGDKSSKRDRLAVGQTVVSLYVMEFTAGGTNAPHHHEDEEEIYVLLDGKGDMVAGSGMDGVMAKFPARPGDAYFFRRNCTVGFYSDTAAESKAHILAVRSRLNRTR